MLRLDNITKVYKTSTFEVKALNGVSLCFRKNEFVSILGPSGCGKTTMLNIIGGLDKYTSGDLLINNTSTKKYDGHDWDIYRNHRIGFIFQAYNLIPHENILENVELALTIGGVQKEESVARAKAALDKVGLKDMYYKKPNELSGGQCQRVAIARALVNEPDILLADEPTGALDSETSIQIMNLIKEVSKDKLVIMVTHNKELALEYSTRIVSLLDGKVEGDTNPYSPEEEAKEYLNNASSFRETDEKAKMSWLTAIKLSGRNLMAKFKRTFMTIVASSIGIVGVSAVLAVSYGVRGYIDSVQDDLLSGNPIQIRENAVDFLKLLDSTNNLTQAKIVSDSWKDGKIDVQFAMESLVKASEDIGQSMTTNDISEDYVQFLKDMPEDYVSAIDYKYGINFKNNIYVHANADVIEEGLDEKNVRYSISGLTNVCTTILEGCRGGEYSNYAGMVDGYSNAIGQSIDNEEYVLGQYDVVAGYYPHKADEVMIVLNHENEVTEFVLTLLGLYDQDMFANAIYHFSDDPRFNKDLWAKQQSITVESMLGKEYYYYPNDSIFHENPAYDPDADASSAASNQTVFQPFFYDWYDQAGMGHDNGLKLKVTGVLTPKESVSYGCLSSGLYYTPALAQKMIEDNYNSKLATFIRNYAKDNDTTGFNSTIANVYNFDLIAGIGYSTQVLFEGEALSSSFLVGSNNNISALLGMLASASSSGSGSGLSIKKNATLSVHNVGGSKIPSSIDIYPLDFDNKFLATDYLKTWNSEEDISLSTGKVLKAADRSKIEYTDNLEIIISMINGIVDIVTIALVAFTALSLVVSTVMIGIITFVSVMERVKEIGVIRSLGGRKKDVAHLFNAETFIIGIGGGLFGLAVTYLLQLFLNITIGAIYGIGMIANLPIFAALIILAGSALLTTLAGLVPASSAAKQDPVVALRSE
ncbi:MAG: ABC transporter ATP-binding protein/permease [Bacilli bacterium]|nr:ABC transporter ATP-binding protein/permease [Bacilli bacterium]